MVEKKITIINKLGLHARASAKFVGKAGRYQSQINVIKNNKAVNGKSIMAVMMLAASQGTELTLQIEGPDENEMLEAMEQLINNKFDEVE